MKILITNDDGIFAPGINELAKALVKKGHELLIAAPGSDMSCVSHGLTLRRPLHADPTRLEGLAGVRAYAIDGLPCDCVRLALGNLDFAPDVIVSGINNASNLGTDAVYSGTVSAAIEGFMVNIPSIAVSKDTFDPVYMDEAAAFFADMLPELMRFFESGAGMLNVNIPSAKREDYKGIRAARTELQSYELAFDEQLEPEGRIAYRVRPGKLTIIDEEEETDERMMREGFVVITPLTYDITDMKRLALAKSLFERDL